MLLKSAGSSKKTQPHSKPAPNQAIASTRRTGTPSNAAVSRLFAIARMAVPVFVRRRKTPTPITTANANASAST